MAKEPLGMEPITLHWFRQDLRIWDNPALNHAAQNGRVLPLYIVEDSLKDPYAMGGAGRLWLHHSLKALNESLEGALAFYRGNPLEIFEKLLKHYPIQSIHWNRCYDPWRIDSDTKIKQFFQEKNIHVQSHNGSLLWEPWEVLKKDKQPYKVFTPFYRKGCLGAPPPRNPLPKPDLQTFKDPQSLSLENLSLCTQYAWEKTLMTHWTPGEDSAHKVLDTFLDEKISRYKKGRDFPGDPFVSRLSPHLHFGEISPNHLWYAVQAQEMDENRDHFLSELGWREFSHSLLYHFPKLIEQNLQSKFDIFPWQKDERLLETWKKGMTGYPIVDAGMRELWQTGYMHNRVRMIVGSFLVKNLLIHWKEGERWFWDCLLDADLANNCAGWQWVAGCGSDAAPYFRIFNPITQGQKFDPEGTYTKRFLPELKNLPPKYLFNPFEAPDFILKEAGVRLGTTYPHPIVDLKNSRNKALEAYQACSPPKDLE